MEKVKQTAVDWLADELSKYDIHNPISLSNWDILKQLVQQAKEMEAEKDAKYNEMLEMLKCLIRVAQIEPDLYYEVRRLIKKSTNLKSK
jgi:hypothetical protein